MRSPEARARILAAAGDLLRRRRYCDVSVDELMTASNLSRTVFYRHFRGLPQVVLGLLDELVASIEATPHAGWGSGSDLLRRQLEMVVATYDEHGAVLLALEHAASEDPEVARARQAWIDRAVGVSVTLLERGMRRGVTPSMPVHDVARSLHAMNRAYLLELVAGDGAIDRARAVEALWTVWVRTTTMQPGEDRSSTGLGADGAR